MAFPLNIGHKPKKGLFETTLISLVIVFFFTFASHALAMDGFACCRCTIDKIQNICTLVPMGKTCDTSAATLKETFKKDVTCTTLEDDKCKSKNSTASGSCINEPATAEKITVSSVTSVPQNANQGVGDESLSKDLGVPIPGVSMPQKVYIQDGKILNPALATYIIGIQKYMLGLTLIVAAIMIVWGGFRYLTSPISGELQKAKDIIQDSIIGLVIVLSATAILSNINPQTATLTALQIDKVQKQGTPSDINKALAQTQNAVATPNPMATVQGSGAAAVDASKPKKDTLVKSKKGGYVAPGFCPPDMVAIKHSDNYKYMGAGNKINVDSFCIDRYEAPNQLGAKPLNGVQNIEADLYCDAIGKRLCTVTEWQRACSGPEGKNKYGYGDKFIKGVYVQKITNPACLPNGSIAGVEAQKTTNPPAPCNYDTASPLGSAQYLNDVHALDKYYPKFVVEAIFHPNNPDLIDPDYKKAYEKTKLALDKLTASEPSGSRPRCVTSEGVVDMVGNVAEIVMNEDGLAKGPEARQALGPAVLNKVAYSWMSYYWSPVAHNDCASVKAGEPTCFEAYGGKHSLDWRGMENGFRCCMDLDDKPQTDPSYSQETPEEN